MPTKTQMVTEVQRMLNLESDTRITSTIIQNYLDWAFISVARQVPCLAPAVAPTIALVASQSTYELADFSPDDALRMYNITAVKLSGCTTTGLNKHLIVIPYDRMERLFPEWESTTGTPEYCSRINGATVTVTPAPSTAFMTANASGKLAIRGYMTPDVSLWDTTEVPDVSDSLQRLIEIHAANSITIGTAEDETTQWRDTKLGQMFAEGIAKESGLNNCGSN